jgi:hypothetical protein
MTPILKYYIAFSLGLAISAMAQAALPAATKHSLDLRIDHDHVVLNAAVKKAFNQLLDDYQSVIKIYLKNNDPDGAALLMKERNETTKLASRPIAGIPMHESGWTILFQSSNPLLWDIDCSNADSYSVRVECAPRDCKYLRVKRMDTGDFIIIPTNYQSVAGNSWHSLAWFRGDKRINRQACNLGVVDEKHVVPDGNPFMAGEGNGHHSGWGFGESGSEEKQTWQWDSQQLDATVIEISVTSRELTSLEEAKMMKAE